MPVLRLKKKLILIACLLVCFLTYMCLKSVSELKTLHIESRIYVYHKNEIKTTALTNKTLKAKEKTKRTMQAETGMPSTSSVIESATTVIRTYKIQRPINMPFDQYCENLKKEWSSPESDLFIKRGAVYFFINISMLRIFVLSKKTDEESKEYNLDVEIYIYDRFVYRIQVNDPIVENAASAGNYNMQVIDALLKIDVDLSKIERNLLKVKVKVSKREKTKSQAHYLFAQIKQFKNEDFLERENSLLCSKCIHGANLTVTRLRWWLEMNRLIGFNKISICYHDTIEFNKLFEEFKEYVETTHFECVPNLVDNKSKYLSSHLSLNNEAKFELINRIIVNECYLNKMASYKRIAIYDVDELILPKKFNVFDLNSIKSRLIESKAIKFSDVSINDVNNYADDLISENRYQPPRLLYFGQAYYLPHKLTNLVLDLLEERVKKVKNTDRINFKIPLVDRDREHGMQVNIEITINSESELIYARSLVNAYRSLIMPYLDSNKEFIGEGLNFDRFFMITSDVNKDADLGKSIHDTRESFEVNMNFPIVFLDQETYGMNTRGKYKSRTSPNNLETVPFKLGHVSHFRSISAFKQPQKSISVEFFHIDLNYFYCFFMPFVEELKKN